MIIIQEPSRQFGSKRTIELIVNGYAFSIHSSSHSSDLKTLDLALRLGHSVLDRLQLLCSQRWSLVVDLNLLWWILGNHGLIGWCASITCVQSILNSSHILLCHIGELTGPIVNIVQYILRSVQSHAAAWAVVLRDRQPLDEEDAAA